MQKSYLAFVTLPYIIHAPISQSGKRFPPIKPNPSNNSIFEILFPKCFRFYGAESFSELQWTLLNRISADTNQYKKHGCNVGPIDGYLFLQFLDVENQKA